MNFLLTDRSIDKLTALFGRLTIDHSFNSSHLSGTKANILWFQLLKFEDLLLFSVLYHYEVNIFVFWTVVLQLDSRKSVFIVFQYLETKTD